MRRKLVLTIAVALATTLFAVVVSGGPASGASVPGTGISVPVPTISVPNCPPGKILDPTNLVCIPQVTPPSAPTPPGGGGGGGGLPGVGGGGGGTTTTSPGTTTTTSPSGSNGASVTVSPAGQGGRGGAGGGNGLTGGVGPGKAKNQGKRQQKENLRPPAHPYQSDGTPTVSNPSTTIAAFGPAPIGVPNFVIDQFEIPPFLLPIYQACGTEYDIPWEVLAGINKIETAFGTNLNVSSAGAMGWMQFIPSTWQAYGVDANGDGRKDPYNPVDAICAAARYLRAAGGAEDLRSAIFSYNHADWYVDEVLLYARSYGKIPEDLLGSLTGLTEGAHFPIAANARYADDISAREAIHDSKTGRKQYGNAANVIESSPTRRGINIYSHKGAPVVAVNDGVIKQIGTSPKLGRFLVLQDAYGNRFTYAQLGSIAHRHPVPKPAKLSAKDFKLVSPPSDRAPQGPATVGAGSSDAKTVSRKASPDASLGRQLDDMAGHKLPAYTTFKNYFKDVLGLNRKEAKFQRLREGSKVVGGTILGRVGGPESGAAPHINFSIRPAGRGAPRIDPKPILDGWKLLEATAIYRAAGRNPFASNLGVGGVLLMSKEALIRRVLADPRLSIYSCGRSDIQTGQIDRRILAAMEYLVEKGFRLTITSLKCGHSFLTTSGNVSEHTTGDAMDIAEINGIPVTGHQGPGTLAAAVIQSLLELQGTMAPHQIISLMDFPGPQSFPLSDHYDHVHVGYHPIYDSSELSKQFTAMLKPDQWTRLIKRLGEIQNPQVPLKPSKAALPAGNRKDKGKQTKSGAAGTD